MHPPGKDNTAGAKSDPQNIIKTELDKIMSNIGFGLSGIATETTVVDSVGQRLVLRIDNYLGGGGQRRVTIYCPFWIVNTTEHALKYRQEGKGSYVSGTVSEGRDGSRPVDGSDRNARNSVGSPATLKHRGVSDQAVSPPPREKGIRFKKGKNKSLTLSSPTALRASALGPSSTSPAVSPTKHFRAAAQAAMVVGAFQEPLAGDVNTMIFSGKVRVCEERNVAATDSDAASNVKNVPSFASRYTRRSMAVFVRCPARTSPTPTLISSDLRICL